MPSNVSHRPASPPSNPRLRQFSPTNRASTGLGAVRRAEGPVQTETPASLRGRRPHAKLVAYQPASCCSVTPFEEEWTNQPDPT